jgi:hypothetical protein
LEDFILTIRGRSMLSFVGDFTIKTDFGLRREHTSSARFGFVDPNFKR